MMLQRSGKEGIAGCIAAAAAAVICLSVGAGDAIAAITTTGYTLNQPNQAMINAAVPAPYGTVGVSLNDVTQVATITFTAAQHDGYTYVFGSNDAVEVNVNSATFTASTATGNGLGTMAPDSGNSSEFGVFNLSYKNSDGPKDSHTLVSFTVTNTSVATWSTASNVLTPNATGYLAAGHIFAFGTADYLVNGTQAQVIVTGYAGNGPEDITVPVPEPMSLAIWGLGVACCGVVGFRRKRALARS